MDFTHIEVNKYIKAETDEGWYEVERNNVRVGGFEVPIDLQDRIGTTPMPLQPDCSTGPSHCPPDVQAKFME